MNIHTINQADIDAYTDNPEVRDLIGQTAILGDGTRVNQYQCNGVITVRTQGDSWVCKTVVELERHDIVRVLASLQHTRDLFPYCRVYVRAEKDVHVLLVQNIVLEEL